MINLFRKIYYEKYSKKSYSISAVDLVIDRLFSNIKKGIYVDIGCNHPIKYNNTYLLYKRGWDGINIDLDKKSIVQFNKLRKNDTNINTLVTSKDDEEKLFYFYHERSAINTISKDLADSRTTKPKKVLKLKGKTINTIIESTRYKNKKINLISIDIENYEYEALENFDFHKYKVDAIVAEITDIKQKNLEIYKQNIDYILNSNLYKLLIKNNYKLINWVNADLIFFRK